MKGPCSLLEATRFFSDPEKAHAYLRDLRWPDGIIPCPGCGNTTHYYLATQKRWKCRACSKQFSVKVGTIFEASPLGLDKWLIAMFLITNAKNGISSCEIARALEVTQKSAWFMLHRIRLAMANGSLEKMGGKNGTPIETDETFVGGKARNMHKSRKEARGINTNPMSGKAVVMGILERGGCVRTFHVKDNKRSTLVPRLRANVHEDSTLYSDANPAYVLVANYFRHEAIDHAVSYVDGLCHTNGMENFWSLLKRTIRGTYVSVEPFHLSRYLAEQEFRYNFRFGNDGRRFEKVASNVSGKRLTYKQLTGKECQI